MNKDVIERKQRRQEARANKSEEVVLEMELTRPARKEGADRYETKDGGVNFYIPQDISRDKDGDPAEKLTLIIRK